MKSRRTGGFTILEVTLYLSITIGMFVIAFTAFSGQQQKTEFAQSARDLQQKIQDVTNDVATGNFPRNGDFSCEKGIGDDGPQFTKLATANADNIGTNSQCIVVGRVIHFGPTTGSCTAASVAGHNTSNCNQINIYSLAGNRTTGQSNNIVSTVAESIPKVMQGLGFDTSEEYPLKFNYRITRVFSRNASSLTNVGAVGFITSIDGSGDLTLSGSYTTDVYRFTSFSVGSNDKSGAIGSIESNLANSSAAGGLEDGVHICLTSDNGGIADISIGANSGSLNTAILFDDNVDPGCKP